MHTMAGWDGLMVVGRWFLGVGSSVYVYERHVDGDMRSDDGIRASDTKFSITQRVR
jgi:hypothetical protein